MTRKKVFALICMIFSVNISACADLELCRINTAKGVSGKYLNAWAVANLDFMNEPMLTQGEKDLGKYSVDIFEDGSNYIVYYHPNLLSKEESKEKHRVSDGVEVKYWIDKQKMVIEKRLFYKQ